MATIKDVIPLDSSSLSGVSFTAAEAGLLGGGIIGTVGTVYADACVTANVNKNITGINDLTCNGTTAKITCKTFTDGTLTITGGIISGYSLGGGSTIEDAVLNNTVSGTAILNTLAGTPGANKIVYAATVKSYADAKVTNSMGSSTTVAPSQNAVANYVPDEAGSITSQGSLATASTVGNSVWDATDLSVGNGGTGVSSLTNYGVMYGGTTVGVTAAGAVNRVLVGKGSNAPVFDTINNGYWSGADLVVGNGGTGASSHRANGLIFGGTGAEGNLVTGALQSLSDNGNLGQALVSGGAGNLPSWGSIGVPGGGTGVSTIDAGGVVCGGTTNTGNIRVIAPPSAAGKVLTSAAAHNALPTWEDPAGGWTFLETLTLSASAATLNIPAGATSVRLLIDNLDAGTGSGNLLLEIGDSSGYSTTYNSVVHQVGGSSGDDQNDFILAVSIDAADDHYGVVELFKKNTTSNDWIIQGKIGSDDTGRDLYTSVGKGVLAGEMDRLQLNFSVAGTFSTGTVDIWTYR